MWNSKEALKGLALELVKVQSISNTKGEIDMANLVYDKLSQLDYYRENPNHLNLVSVNDELGRFCVCALMKSKKQTKKTLLTLCHLDTVGVEDAGSLKEYIFDANKYTEKLKENIDSLDEDSKKDLLSGNWLFGRGIMDMKTGLAIQMSLIEHFSSLEDFEGNIMLVAVADEEANSAGAISVIPYINKILEKENLEPVAVLNCEPDFSLYKGDGNKYIYTGSCGKLLPGFFVVGKEVHVGEILSGMNANLIGSELIRRLELNTDLCDKIGEDITMPPTCLKYKDNKDEYNVQTPISSTIYYNLQTFKITPKEVLEKLKIVCYEAITASMEKLNKARIEYEKITNGKYIAKDIDMNIKVLTFDELYSQVLMDNGKEFNIHLENKIKDWLKDKNMDERDLSSAIVSEVHKFSKDRNPMIIIFFAPPYYPNVGINNELELDKKLLKVVDNIIQYSKEEYNIEIKKQNYFQGLSDLSYFRLENEDDIINFLGPNMPIIKYKYKLPLEEIKKLNVPVVNLGPHGKDAHKFTERILVDYSYDILPRLIKK
ncbi:M20/M25/M40 family metallo-hydrolase [[Clostridium] dakarense]|uniref:M20/M25/M40 family metallo-hydrolase n=1 Tax=Faecalimicrobium dakarense TaxID=1301100 RepID=UPI0004B2089C|nr:M20/M25/M40 family metallo-hydrolase [[Clostridium] dakarense]